MKKFIFSLLLILTLFILIRKDVNAYIDPSSSANNRFGIHLFNEEDLEDAARLVNSNGGDWGYITFVITESERNRDRWQKAFDKMRRLHLIPIVRIATSQEKNGWKKPDGSQIDSWVSFLSSLNWVTQNRYVIIGNEPNHREEWGGSINPAEYAKYLKDFSSKLRSASSDFFILPAALDASTRNSSSTMEEGVFIKQMLKADPNTFDAVDGWNSHSYPNPDFSGKETDKGKGTIYTYDWELSYLQGVGVSKRLPTFITETGWSTKTLSENDVGNRFTYAFKYVWDDPRVIAVTPFILNYPEEPFADLSWKRKNKDFKSFYNTILNLNKNKGAPRQNEGGQILAAFSQPISPLSGDFSGIILAKNTGQSIWNFNDISIGSESSKPFIKSYSFNDLEPMRIGLIIFKAESPDRKGLYSSSLFLKGKNGQKITNSFPIDSVILDLSNFDLGGFLHSIFGGEG